GRKVNIAAADTRNGGLWIFEACKGLLNSFPQLRQMQQARVGAGGLHVFGNRDDAVVGAQRDDVISAADFGIQVREQIGEILVQAHKNVLNFAAARTKCVADDVDGRISNSEKIGPA